MRTITCVMLSSWMILLLSSQSLLAQPGFIPGSAAVTDEDGLVNGSSSGVCSTGDTISYTFKLQCTNANPSPIFVEFFAHVKLVDHDGNIVNQMSHYGA